MVVICQAASVWRVSASAAVLGCVASCVIRGSLQKVQGHRARVNADLTPSTGGPVGHAYR